MQLPDFKSSYDVVVIGAGVGGLTAAALLSKAGLSVCVLEREPHPGGYLAGFRRKDFRFDTAIHWLNQYAPGGMITTLFDVLGHDYPLAEPQKAIKRYKGEGYDYLLTANPDELKRQWQEEFPADSAGIERFFAAAKKLGRSFANFGHIFRSEETMTAFQRLRNKRNLLRFAMPFIPFIRFTGDKGMKKGLSKYFKSEKLHRIFAAEAEMLSCLVPIGWAYYGDYQSPPQGGGQRIPEWLEHVSLQFGADIGYKCGVEEIITEGGTAKGVRFSHRGKEQIVQSKYVVAACDVETLYEKMLPDGAVPPALKKKLQNAEIYSSSVTISVALDCPAEALGFGQELIHLAPTKGRGNNTMGDAESSDISILAPSTRDKSLAPEGCGTLTLFMSALMNFEDNWRTESDGKGGMKRGEAYKALKNSIAEIIIRRVTNALSPDLPQHILFYDVATPVTHWRYTGNRDGTMMGARPGRANMQSKVAHYRTPVKNLLLGGHWAELGGGVPVAVKAGANAALLVFKDEKPVTFRLLADYIDGKKSLQAVQDSALLQPYLEEWHPEPTPAEKKAMREE